MQQLRLYLKNNFLIQFVYNTVYVGHLQYGLLWYRLVAAARKKTIVHFLHIGKTGGTAIKYALREHNPYRTGQYYIFSHSHNFTMQHVRDGEKVFFCIRNPIDRFVSGFYSRMRQGQPRTYSPWSPEEKLAFARFKTPNELAIALSANHPQHTAAVAAMQHIGHVRTAYADWLGDVENIQSRLSDILFVGRQEYLADDFEQFKKIMQLPPHVTLPQDTVHAHKNPQTVDKHLSEQAIENVKQWYAQDYECIKFLEENELVVGE